MSSPQSLLWLNLFGADTRKLIAVMLVSMAIILALPFMAVFALGTDALSFLASSPDATSAETDGFYMGGPVPGDTYVWGNCTYWAFAMRLWSGRPISTWWGNANTWDDNARAEGYDVDHTPRAGAVFQSDDGFYGHVAYVVSVDATTGSWTISEMNAPHLNVVTRRTFARDAAAHYSFIHGKKGDPEWTPLPITQPPSGIGTGLLD